MRLNAWCCAWCTHMPRHEPHVWFDLAHLPPRWHCEPSIASQGIHHHFDSGRTGWLPALKTADAAPHAATFVREHGTIGSFAQHPSWPISVPAGIWAKQKIRLPQKSGFHE